MARLERIADVLEAAATALVAAALAVMTAVVIVEVIARYALNAPLIWSNEVATYLFIYAVFFGGSVALRRKELMDVQFIRDRCPAALQRAMAQLSHLIILGFTLVGAAYSIVLIHTSFRTGTISPALEIPMLYVYLPIPAGFGLMGFFSLVQFLRGLRGAGPAGGAARPGGAGAC
ncbi:MAG: TRAP transporter small permease [Candidatus Methylomirabilales bacterium]